MLHSIRYNVTLIWPAGSQQSGFTGSGWYVGLVSLQKHSSQAYTLCIQRKCSDFRWLFLLNQRKTGWVGSDIVSVGTETRVTDESNIIKSLD